MDGGISAANSFASGVSTIGTLIFQWVPSILLSISTAGGMVLPDSSASGTQAQPFTGAVTVSQVQDYLQSMSTTGGYQEFIINWGLFAAISIFISLLLASLLVYCVTQLRRVRHFEHQRFEAASATVAANDVPRTHLRWERIMAEAASDSEQSWRLAILEADIMLGELLDSRGYKGETMADKMRQVERADFHTIDLAWEAHRMRNRIAHESAETRLDQRDVQHAIGLYQKVFHEFDFVA